LGAAIALHGLAEVGLASDAPLAEPFIAAPRVRCRAAALRCLARLAGDQHLDTFVAALRDPSLRVCRAAAATLRGRVHRAGIDRVLAILDPPPHRHVRRILLRLLFESDQWAPLGPLVRCAAGEDEEEARWAASLLRVWFSRYRGWTRNPPKRHVAAFRDALADGGHRLGTAQRGELEFLLSTLTKA